MVVVSLPPPPQKRRHPPWILIAVMSSPDHFARQQESRATWMRSLKFFPRVWAIFVFGRRSKKEEEGNETTAATIAKDRY